MGFCLLWSDDLFIDWLKFMKTSMLPAMNIEGRMPASKAEMNWNCKRTELFASTSLNHFHPSMTCL